MTNIISENQFTYRIVGLDQDNQKVLASVFADKLKQLVKALEASDKSANNGVQNYHYLIVELNATSASAKIVEKKYSMKSPENSSISTLTSCINSIANADFDFSLRYPDITKKMLKLSENTQKKYSHAEFHCSNKIIKIDSAFYKNALEAENRNQKLTTSEKWFKGCVIGSFDGQVLVVDYRDKSAPKSIIRLTSGGVEIECNYPEEMSNEIISILKQRVNIVGRAYYSGNSGLPNRIEILEKPELVRTHVEFSKWKNAFSKIENSDTWEEFN